MSSRSVFPLDYTAAQALLTGHLGADGHQHLVPMGEGDFCLAFREQTRVVRVAKHAEAAAALRTEARVLAHVGEQLPLPVPRPTFHSASGHPPFSVHEEVRGEVLTRDAWLELPMAARNRAAADLATFLRALHSLPIEAGQRCGLRLLDQAEFARQLREPATRVLFPLLVPEIRRQLDGLLVRCSAASLCDPPAAVLIHCDIAPGHVLFDPTNGWLTGIIDFGDLALGDPTRDFIYIYEDFGSEMLAAVLSHYQPKEVGSMLPRIRTWYLLETVAWTVQMCVEQEEAEMQEGISEIIREISTPGLMQA